MTPLSLIGRREAAALELEGQVGCFVSRTCNMGGARELGVSLKHQGTKTRRHTKETIRACMTLTDVFDLSLIGRREAAALELDGQVGCFVSRTCNMGGARELGVSLKHQGAKTPRHTKETIRACMTLTHVFDLSLIGRREAVALEFEGQSWTFGEVEARSNRMARLIESRGLTRGDRLCVQLANCVEMIDLYLACVKLGVIFVPINVLYRERETSHILTDAEPKMFVRDGEAAEMARVAEEFSAERRHVALDGDAPAAIVYTSGTTGTSKGAVLTHNNLATNALNVVVCWQITSADRFLLALPLFHVHGLGNGLHAWLVSGCRMRLLERFEHQTAAATFLDFRPTLFFGVPTIYVRLLEAPPEIASSMRLFVSGSAPLPAQVLEDFRARFGHVILERYGMTETLMNATNPYAGERRPGTVGLPMPGVSIRLLDASGNPVADGETGELLIRGPNVFAGYWRREDATREAFQDGYFRSGDLAQRSPDGYYTLVGRKTDLIICGGFNVYPREIEEFLLEQPEVAEAAVVGAPDAVRGEAPIAYVVPRTALSSEDLEARCRRALASFKVPRAFVQVEALPRNALGKIQKHLLST